MIFRASIKSPLRANLFYRITAEEILFQEEKWEEA
jgi:hypothetical protein